MSSATRRITVCFVLSAVAGWPAGSLSAAGALGGAAPGEGIVADPALAERIAAYVMPFAERGEFSGVVLVGSRERILYAGAYGMASYEDGTPNGIDTAFRIASITKTFTAAAILHLAGQGVLSLDDPLSRFAPEFPRGDEITIRHLLLHRSGLQNPDYRESFERSIDLEGLVERIAARPLAFDPGTAGAYSNAGYNLLAYVVERASGEPYASYLRRIVFEPLGMELTGHPRRAGRAASEGERPALEARGYLPMPPPASPARPPESDPYGFMIGSGSLLSTAPDLWRWARAVADERLVGWRDLEWPYGWGRVEVDGHSGIEQTGGTTGFVSSLLVFPEGDRFVVALHNVEYGSWVSFGRDLAAIAFGAAPSLRPAPVPQPLDATRLARCAGRYESGGDLLTVRVEGSYLRLYLRDWPIGKFLLALSETRFLPLGDGGELRFGELEGGVFRELSWRFGESGTTYRRLAD